MNCKAAIITILLLIPMPGYAAIKNLGVVGETFEIVEQDVTVELRQRSAHNAAKHMQAIRERMQAYQPDDLHPLPPARADKTFLVDMTYTLDRDLVDADGKVLYPKGFTFNPLDYLSLSIGLVVINGEDPDQVEWFKASPYHSNHKLKLLLTNGQATEMTRQLQRPVFYLTEDIASRLQLAAVPCVAVQKDGRMQITEFHVSEERNEN